MSEIIKIEFISQYHNILLAKYFDINKTKKLISQKYYWLSLRKNVEAYIKSCNIYLTLKAVKHKLYSNL